MIVHPIDYRYGTPEMKRIWSEDSKIKRMVRVEMALLRALAKKGYLSEEEAKEAKKKAYSVTPERVKEIEAEIKHDIMALVKAITEATGCRWVHFGATSNDIIDTATALQLRDSLKILEVKIKRLAKVLADKALEYKDVVCLGRTHGQAALPTTYGFRFALWAAEVARHYIRLQQMKDRLLVGQMSGAVGTQAAFGKDGFEIEEEVMRLLNLKPALISSQIIPRDSYCEYLEFLANLAATLEKIALNFRLLQRAEVGELMEKFEAKQVGSSTMPHKRNPIDCENVCGLARVVRGFVEPQHQSAILWEERDLTNSSAERITLVESTVLADHILTKMIKVVSSVSLNLENIRRNLEMQRGLNLSEAVMIEMTKRGVGRQEAHEILRQAAMRAYENNSSLLDELLKDERVMKYFKEDELREILKPENYLGTARERVERVVRWVNEVLK
ncbi:MULTISPECIES: adenylosuccinate lyase [Archaeoglobus]|jgi:adenylosuccinate lyase|uniref:Adenylosuccinate lyase n=3 Tax=Archaeoglobus fulgidus TaxID=2234 RepID=PUR8_ARCFU|nr:MULTISPECIES: adenylosuccinate lyase [Archaeoglobus]O28041.1 RecName: Full=Adenylosuccinate lyase; Short=ASL; AltName: Full=Adenylosuccinase; Short=ASase [Archaeoglobus fulgidus DSM 4304]AAB89013.1 adenylosuccinate lyase (purB) [Archaeoglobus fulgidus DSM 4304]AIG99249.1 adenylosuccinate lyase [Archaeoglobus fulgidus DSM 8774]KUJ93645.1 MAG: Adenylosuccinate lyase [Archaeoglobus fulgidus]KUK06012.1 MAG: Adenylosuccinate lyase [Archaeoglobus fulgidus]MDI3497922.1 adenylosuccinate lyase [Arc